MTLTIEYSIYQQHMIKNSFFQIFLWKSLQFSNQLVLSLDNQKLQYLNILVTRILSKDGSIEG